MSFRPGDLFGPYRVVAGIGRGAMGAVLLVQHVELGAEYALKVLRQDIAGSADARERFLREMAALAAVDTHPGIVRIHASGILPDGRPYYVMEYVDGQTLARALRHDLPTAEGVEVVIEVAEALGFLHERAIVHRDVKPENVLLAAEGRARLSDFGLAKAVGDGSQRLTLTGELIGTPAYMAPEQARGEDTISPATDVYSCGVVLYEILSGRLPYQATSAIAITRLVARGRPYPKPSRLRAVDAAVEAVCLKAMSFSPEARYADGNELAAALRAAIAEPPAKARSKAPLVAAIALLVGGALGAAAWIASDSEAATAERVPAPLLALEASAKAEDWEAVLAARDSLGREWAPQARERFGALVLRAREELLAEAWEARDFTAGGVAWDAGRPLVNEHAAYVLLGLGRVEEVPLEALPAGEARAWAAAWAGNLDVCQASLAELEPGLQAAVRWRLRGWLPALAVDERPAGAEPVDALARGERALALGRVGQAAGAFAELDAPGELAARFAEARARLALAWGDPEPLAKLVGERLARTPSGLAALRTWSLAREVAPWLEVEAQGALLDPLPAGLRDLERSWSLDAAARWDAVRAAAPEGRRDALIAAGADAVLASRSSALAELDACRRGLGGPAGALLARVDQLLAALELGVSLDPEALELARSWLARVARARATGPAFSLVQSRLRRLQARPLATDFAALQEVSPGDPAWLSEAARAADRWAEWQVGETGERSGSGFEQAAQAWAAVEEVSTSEGEARRARLARLRALLDQAAASAAPTATWSNLWDALASELEGVQVTELARTRRALGKALLASNLDAFDAQREQLLSLARGLTELDLDAVYLGAATGDRACAEAYVALVGDLPALALLELRRVETSPDRAALVAQARETAEVAGVPYGHLLAAVAPLDGAEAHSPSPLDMARVVERAPEDVLALVALLRAASPARVDTLNAAIESSKLGEQGRGVARALVLLWADLRGRLGDGACWSLAAANELEACLEREPAHPGLLQLHALALLTPAGRQVGDPWVQRAVEHELWLARLALAHGLGAEVLALRVGPADEVEPRVDALGAKGWLWTPEVPLAAGEAPAAWPQAVHQLRPWEANSLTGAFQGAARGKRNRAALALFVTYYDSVRLGVRTAEQNRAAVESFRRLLSSQQDPGRRRAAEGLVFGRHASSCEGAEADGFRLRGLRALIDSAHPRPRRTLAGLWSGARVSEFRVTPQLPSLWAQEIGLSTGRCQALHRAELWAAVQPSEAGLFSVAQLRDPWSPTRAVLAGLRDGFDPHQDTTLGWLRDYDLGHYALALLRAGAFDSRASPVVDAYYRIVWDLRYAATSEVEHLEAGIALTRIFERLDGPTFRGLRADLLLDLAYYLPEDERAQPLAEGARLSQEVDPSGVSGACESPGTARWRRVRGAALGGDSAALERALEELTSTEQRWGLETAISYDPWQSALREHASLRSWVPEDE